MRNERTHLHWLVSLTDSQCGTINSCFYDHPKQKHKDVYSFTLNNAAIILSSLVVVTNVPSSWTIRPSDWGLKSRSMGGQNGKNSNRFFFFFLMLTPHPHAHHPMLHFTTPATHSPLLLSIGTIALCLTMYDNPIGPSFPALVVAGHALTLILFWHFRKTRKEGKVCVLFRWA